MSVRAVSWAIDQAPVGGNTTARMILVSLADKADEYGRDAYKYVSAIADSIRKSDSTVSRNLAWMEEIGVIERGNQHLVDSYPEYARPIVYDLRLDLVQEPTERQTKKGRPGRPRKTVKDPKPATEHTPSQQEDNTRRKTMMSRKPMIPTKIKPSPKIGPGFSRRRRQPETRSHRCTHPGRISAPTPVAPVHYITS
ncbi:MAG: winged helix-turn-helix domain-containing protein [Bifidobacterium dentium]